MKMRKAVISGIATLAATSVLVACGDAPDEDSENAGPAESDFKPCIVSDEGGFDDKSFNQLGFEGITKAADELGVEAVDVESATEADYAPNLESLVSEGCSLIVAVGFKLSAATIESATNNPEIDYVLIDDPADADQDGETDAENIKPLLYDTAQGAFMAGYAAADFSKTKVVGTYGGLPIGPVTSFMDGFANGVAYYNEQKSADVTVRGWDVASQNGSFTGGFAEGPEATNAAKQLIDQDADVLLPVGGPIYKGALTSIADSGADAVMIGTDADVFETDPATQDVILTSILKNMDVSVYDVVLAAGNGDFDAETYTGTLENDGVGLASFHNFEDQVNPELQGEIDAIREGIIDGSISATS